MRSIALLRYALWISRVAVGKRPWMNDTKVGLIESWIEATY